MSGSRFGRVVGVALGNRNAGVDVGQEDIDDAWVEMLPASLADDLDALLDGEGFLVVPFADQGIEDISQRHQAGGERNGVAGQAARIAGAVPFLVVVQGNLRRHAKDGGHRIASGSRNRCAGDFA